MKFKAGSFLLLLVVLNLFSIETSCASDLFDPGKLRKRNIVLIAGEKTHGPGAHEYIKTVRLLKVMLDNSNAKNIQTTFVLHGWPDDVTILDKADLILFFTDGGDGDSTMYPPFMKPERMAVMEKQMKRGCGFSLIHYSTFAPDNYGQKVLEWGGGYFDWQNDQGEHEYYSAIKTLEGSVTFPNPSNPIVRGVLPFVFTDEFYYDIRFRDNDNRLKPIVEISQLPDKHQNGKAVAWAVERSDGGRGFSTSMGHYYSNWNNPDFRKLLLNGIVWASGAEVPDGGVTAQFYSDNEVTRKLYGKSLKALMLKRKDNPENLEKGNLEMIVATYLNDHFYLDISTNMEDLKQYDLKDYEVLIVPNNDWLNFSKLSDDAKKSLQNYLNSGGGLFIVPKTR